LLTFQRFLQDEQGQDLIEYTLLMTFIGIASAAVFTQVGPAPALVWNSAKNVLANAASYSGS
jgi:Flp pilus assembly pilin Flp